MKRGVSTYGDKLIPRDRSRLRRSRRGKRKISMICELFFDLLLLLV